MWAHSLAIVSAVAVAGCATPTRVVRQPDLDAWVGRPVSDLDKHPIFLTMRVVKTRAADGTEIRNYVNGSSASSCSTLGSANAYLNTADYDSFTNCMQTFEACNNVFYINKGVISRYTPIGTSGAHCYTDDRSRPDFAGATNL
jgi:hypothetical protein